MNTFEPNISRGGSGLPSRIIMHGVEGIGKTSIAANAPNPIFGMTTGETGLLTLIDSGQIGETDHFDEFASWSQMMSALEWLASSDVSNRTLVIDTINGAERMCFDHVVQTKFSGDVQQFMSFGRGPEVGLSEWSKLLTLMDRIRQQKRMGVFCLCHTKIKTFRNPEGDDYDRYTPDMHEKIWGLTHKWADVVLFANFESFAKKDRHATRAKGVGGKDRTVYTQRTAAYDAKNRLGLPAEISLGYDAVEGWRNLANEIRSARQRAVQNAAGCPFENPVADEKSEEVEA